MSLIIGLGNNNVLTYRREELNNSPCTYTTRGVREHRDIISFIIIFPGRIFNIIIISVCASQITVGVLNYSYIQHIYDNMSDSIVICTCVFETPPRHRRTDGFNPLVFERFRSLKMMNDRLPISRVSG